MPKKTDFTLVVCCAVCVALLPVLFAAGVIALVFYAVVSRLPDWSSPADPKPSNAREIAQRVCFGHGIRR